MTNLLDELYELGLSTYQVDQTFTIIDKWLEQRYPVMSQVYRQQMFSEVLSENRERAFRSIPTFKRVNADMQKQYYRPAVFK
jgi:hypothetical protein